MTLSVGTIGAVVAVVCLSVGFGTDNWHEIRVNRTVIRARLQANEEMLKEMDTDVKYFDRDEGLFRICFPEKKPRGLSTYISPVQTECTNINYYFSENKVSAGFSEERWERIYMARSVIGLYITGFFFLFLSFFTGITGCWKRSHGNVVATGLLQLLAALVDAGAMGLWHGVQYYDYQKLRDEMAYFGWPDILKHRGYTNFYYGWSYILAWIGIGMSLMAAILFLCAANCLRREKKVEQAKNVQYLMPMYPDKRQPYTAYPGPYYQYGY